PSTRRVCSNVSASSHSWKRPPPARTVVLPFLNGDHVTPPRGFRFQPSVTWVWNSWRRPMLTVRFFLARQSSWRYSAPCHSEYSTSGFPSRRLKVDGRPAL